MPKHKRLGGRNDRGRRRLRTGMAANIGRGVRRYNQRRDALFGAVGVKIAADWYLNGAEPRAPAAFT